LDGSTSIPFSFLFNQGQEGDIIL